MRRSATTCPAYVASWTTCRFPSGSRAWACQSLLQAAAQGRGVAYEFIADGKYDDAEAGAHTDIPFSTGRPKCARQRLLVARGA